MLTGAADATRVAVATEQTPPPLVTTQRFCMTAGDWEGFTATHAAGNATLGRIGFANGVELLVVLAIGGRF